MVGVAETVAVSGGQGNASASACEGVWKPRVCRGRPFSSAAIASRTAWGELAQVGVLGQVLAEQAVGRSYVCQVVLWRAADSMMR